MNIRKLNKQLSKILESNEYNSGNMAERSFKLIEPGVYMARCQSAVCHRSYPNHWQYFGPYLKAKQLSNCFEVENERNYEDENKENEFEITTSKESITVVGKLIKTWEEIEEEEDNIHHFYWQEYKILEVK